jgi:hypothetical protein
MREINKIAEGLFEKIRDRFEDVSLGDDKAKATQDPEKARFFNFDYTADGHDYGNITISIIDEASLKVYFSKNISSDLDKEQRDTWYSFLRELREFAKRNLLSFEPRDITRSTLKHRDIQQASKADDTYDKDEVVAESLYGTRKSSYEKKGPVKIILRHSAVVDETKRGARTRKINSILLQNKDGERFKLPENNLRYARAMARHLSEGGSLMDDFGQHITKIAEEVAKLRPFKSGMRNRMFEDEETQAMAEAAFEYHGLLNHTLKRLTGKKGYKKIKEHFHTEETLMDDVDTVALKEKFVKKIFDDRLESALPIVQKAYEMKKNNKFAEYFESWADTVAEGAWAIPDNDDEVSKLIDILSEPLPVGVDAQNATNALYHVLGDDGLFDRLGELAETDPEADARDVIVSWLQDNLPQIYQQIENEIGDPDIPAEPAETGSEGGDLDESYTPPPVMINGKQLDLSTIELDGVESYDRPDYADAYASAATFTDGMALTDDELDELSDKHGDVINMRAHDMLEGNTYGAAIPGGTENMLSTTNEDDDSQDDQLANIESIQSAIIRRILNDINQHSELLKKAGPEGVMNASLDVASFHAPMEEIGSSDISIMVREVYREVGVDYPEEVNEDKEECKYCGGDCPNDEEHACDGYLGDIDDLYKVAEAKDKVTYDPKTGKLSGWEHEGDWKKSKGKKKDPVGKIHHMSDVARRRTEKMSKDETLEEAFERALGEEGNVELEVKKQANLVKKEIGYPNYKAFDGHDVRYISDKTGVTPEQVCKILHILVPAGLNVDETFERLVNEGAINVGDMIRDKTQPEIQGKVVGDMEENYTIKVEDDIYHIKKLNAEKVAKEAIEMPDNPDYSKYDKPTFQRKGITPGQPTKTLPGVKPANQREKQPWAGIGTDEPAYKRKEQHDLDQQRISKLKPANDPKLEDIMRLSGLLR